MDREVNTVQGDSKIFEILSSSGNHYKYGHIEVGEIQEIEGKALPSEMEGLRHKLIEVLGGRAECVRSFIPEEIRYYFLSGESDNDVFHNCPWVTFLVVIDGARQIHAWCMLDEAEGPAISLAPKGGVGSGDWYCPE
jgi:hypothetical protein